MGEIVFMSVTFFVFSIFSVLITFILCFGLIRLISSEDVFFNLMGWFFTIIIILMILTSIKIYDNYTKRDVDYGSITKYYSKN